MGQGTAGCSSRDANTCRVPSYPAPVPPSRDVLVEHQHRERRWLCRVWSHLNWVHSNTHMERAILSEVAQDCVWVPRRDKSVLAHSSVRAHWEPFLGRSAGG